MKRIVGALALVAGVSGCFERKPPFSPGQFVAAKLQCGAVDAYVIESAPNTIAFHGTSDSHIGQANCLREKLSGTDVKVIVLGSQLHEQS